MMDLVVHRTKSPKRSHHSSGYSLVSVLVATAVAGLLAIILMTIIESTTRAMTRATVMEAIDGATKTVQGIIVNKQLCDNALRRNASNQRVTFNGGQVNVERIYSQLSDGHPQAVEVLRRGSYIHNSVLVDSIIYREREEGAGRAERVINNVTYDLYVGELVLRFSVDSNQALLGGSDLRDRVIPLNVLVNRANQQITFCQQGASTRELCEQMGGIYNSTSGECNNLLGGVANVQCSETLAAQHGYPCPTQPGIAQTCSKLIYVAGFQVIGNQVTVTCACQLACHYRRAPDGSGREGNWN